MYREEEREDSVLRSSELKEELGDAATGGERGRWRWREKERAKGSGEGGEGRFPPSSPPPAGEGKRVVHDAWSQHRFPSWLDAGSWPALAIHRKRAARALTGARRAPYGRPCPSPHLTLNRESEASHETSTSLAQRRIKAIRDLERVPSRALGCVYAVPAKSIVPPPKNTEYN